MVWSYEVGEFLTLSVDSLTVDQDAIYISLICEFVSCFAIYGKCLVCVCLNVSVCVCIILP